MLIHSFWYMLTHHNSCYRVNSCQIVDCFSLFFVASRCFPLRFRCFPRAFKRNSWVGPPGPVGQTPWSRWSLPRVPLALKIALIRFKSMLERFCSCVQRMDYLDGLSKTVSKFPGCRRCVDSACVVFRYDLAYKICKTTIRCESWISPCYPYKSTQMTNYT